MAKICPGEKDGKPCKKEYNFLNVCPNCGYHLASPVNALKKKKAKKLKEITNYA